MSRPRPFPVDSAEYPFADHWLERGGAAMHYVDEGAGTPVLMLHGNPAWSFLYREVVRGLEGRCRRLAPDYPGFGLSGHPPGYGYTPREHAGWVRALLDRLELERVVLVLHDWGGPIGLSLAVEEPERVAGLVVCNSWCWPPDLRMRAFSFAMGGVPHGKYLQLRRNFFARVVVPSAIHREERKRPEVLEAYTAPFPTPESRTGTWVFPRAIRASAEWVAGVERRLGVLREKPVEMVWGMRDPAFGREEYVEHWHRHFPGAPVDRIPDASHYVQEDAPERVVAAVERVLGRI